MTDPYRASRQMNKPGDLKRAVERAIEEANREVEKMHPAYVSECKRWLAPERRVRECPDVDARK